jgi:hypothetical protein
MENRVSLTCVVEGGRLRVRITSPGYLSTANCQFPRNLRAEGRSFTVPARAVSLVLRGAKAFYRVQAKDVVEDEAAVAPCLPVVARVYDAGVDDGSCAICLSEARTQVAAPCGHFYACEGCSRASVRSGPVKCAVCRCGVQAFVPRASVE